MATMQQQLEALRHELHAQQNASSQAAAAAEAHTTAKVQLTALQQELESLDLAQKLTAVAAAAETEEAQNTPPELQQQLLAQ